LFENVIPACKLKNPHQLPPPKKNLKNPPPQKKNGPPPPPNYAILTRMPLFNFPRLWNHEGLDKYTLLSSIVI
jgi:hypothetical protein